MSDQAYANQEVPYWLARTGVEGVSFIKLMAPPPSWPNQGSLYELNDGNLYYNGVSLATGGTLSTLANDGAGPGLIFDTVMGNAAHIRTLQADPALASAGISVATVGSEINIGNTLSGANLGVGAGFFAGKSGGSLTFRSIVGGSGITVTQGANDITVINSSGAVNTVANEGAGTGLIFDSVVGATATLRSLLSDPANGGLAIATAGLEVVLGNTLTGSNLGAGSGAVFAAKVGAALQFNSLAGTANGLVVGPPMAGVITIDNTLSGGNVGGGAGVFRDKTGASLNFRSMVAGTGITIAQNADDVAIGALAGTVLTIANEGGGAGVFDAVVGNQANLRSLVGTANGLTVAQGAMTITVDNTLTGANPSATIGAVGPFLSKAAASLNFRSLVAGANIALTAGAPTANDVTIAATGVLTALTNEGGGAQVYDTGTTSALRTLLGTANGLTVTQGAAAITVDNTLTAANLGAGTGTVFAAKSGATLQLNSFAGTANGLTVSAPAGGVVTVDNTLTAANPSVTVGSVGLFNTKTGALLNFRSLVAGANVVLVSGLPTANDVTVAVTGVLTALTNEGGGAQVYDAGTSSALRTLLGTANGLTVTQNATTVTVDNTLTGANLGAGAQVFSAKSAASLNFRSIVAATGSGLSATQNTNDITLSRAVAVWRAVDSKASGTNGGASAANAVQIRTLNTITSSGLSSASVTLAANQLTVAAGLYYVMGSAPAVSTLLAGQQHASFLYDVTNAATAIRGTSEVTGLLANQSSASIFHGFIAPAASTVYEVRQFTQVATGAGLGLAVGQAGTNETYTTISLTRLA